MRCACMPRLHMNKTFTWTRCNINNYVLRMNFTATQPVYFLHLRFLVCAFRNSIASHAVLLRISFTTPFPLLTCEDSVFFFFLIFFKYFYFVNSDDEF